MACCLVVGSGGLCFGQQLPSQPAAAGQPRTDSPVLIQFASQVESPAELPVPQGTPSAEGIQVPPASKGAGTNLPSTGEPQLPQLPSLPSNPTPFPPIAQQEPISEAERAALEKSIGSLEDPRVIPRAWLNQPSREMEQPPNPSALTLADVLASVYQVYPSLQAARLEQQVATGNLVSSWGEFDLKLQGYTLNQPSGFYENYRHGLGLARNTWWGGYLSTGYRVGRDHFQPWYKERETNEGGEFKVAYVQPLLQGRAIDARRVAILQNQLAQQAVAPLVQGQLLFASRSAGDAYWSWVAAGRSLRAQEILLELAQLRVSQIEELIRAQRKPVLDRNFNEVLIAVRQAKVIESRQKLQETAFKLALYLRDEQGTPQIPTVDWLPSSFPPLSDFSQVDVQQQVAQAITRRPELLEMRLQREMVQWDRRLASNQTLPQFDFVGEASQDVGAASSSSRDKGDFELEVGVEGSYPFQLRKARGKLQSTAGKIAQIDQKLRLQTDVITLEIQSAINALIQTERRVKELRRVVETQSEVLRLQEIQFNLGRIDLIELNVQEQNVTAYQQDLIAAQQEWFQSLVRLQVALALDPLEQAMVLENTVEVTGEPAEDPEGEVGENQVPPAVPNGNPR